MIGVLAFLAICYVIYKMVTAGDPQEMIEKREEYREMKRNR